MSIGASASSRIGESFRAPIGVGTLLPMIRKAPDAVHPPLRVIGVDDWAWKKGQRYGTIIVDHERGVVVDILPDRDASTLAHWLKKHPQVEIVTRDRAEVYAQAIQIGSPAAVQAANRWHLLKNLFDTTYSALQPHRSAIEAEIRSCSIRDASAKSMTSTAASNMVEDSSKDARDARLNDTSAYEAEPSMTAAARRRFERNQQIRVLHQQGLRYIAIAAAVRCTVKTIRRVLGADSQQVHLRHDLRCSMLDAYKPLLMKRWTEGCHNAVRLRHEIAALGFRGGITMVRTFLHAYRRSISFLDTSTNTTLLPQRASLRAIAWSVVYTPNKALTDSISQICTGHPAIAQIIDLGRQFAQMARNHGSSDLLSWLDRAAHSGSLRTKIG